MHHLNRMPHSCISHRFRIWQYLAFDFPGRLGGSASQERVSPRFAMEAVDFRAVIDCLKVSIESPCAVNVSASTLLRLVVCEPLVGSGSSTTTGPLYQFPDAQYMRASHPGVRASSMSSFSGPRALVSLASMRCWTFCCECFIHFHAVRVRSRKALCGKLTFSGRLTITCHTCWDSFCFRPVSPLPNAGTIGLVAEPIAGR